MKVESRKVYWVSRVWLALPILLIWACAPSDLQVDRTTTPTVIYAPPVKLGGRGSILVLRSNPASVRTAVGNHASTPPEPLETPDPSPQLPTGDWLAGTWLQNASREDLSGFACNSGGTTTYKADGTLEIFGGNGRWWLDGDKLSEMLTEVNESGDPDDLGRTVTALLRRIGPDEGVLQTNRGWERMLRCRSGAALAVLAGLRRWPGQSFINDARFVFTSRGIDNRMSFVSPQTTEESGWTSQEADRIISVDLAKVREGERTILRLSGEPTPNGTGDVAYVGNPAVRNDLAFVQVIRPHTAAYLYVLRKMKGRWQPVAVLLGPPF